MTISAELKTKKIINGAKVCDIFDNLYQDILTQPYASTSEFMQTMWGRYAQASSSLNGAVFEGILSTILYRSGIRPLYVQAKVSFVPNVEFDFIGYTKECGPVVMSAKTSLRERYKQADLEGMILRQVHRKAKSFLITLNRDEARLVNDKINNGQVLGIDSVVVATEPEFDAMIRDLTCFTFIQPDKIDVITGTRIIPADPETKGLFDDL